jgi:hypothetical protein
MYRVDTRNFGINEIIISNVSSYQQSDNFNPIIEKILLEQRPIDKKNVDRNTGLFIFTELSDAIKFSCRMIGSKIYKVSSIKNTKTFHKGDMNWTEVMSKLKENESALRHIATLYWTDCCKTYKPCWEVIVDKVKVVSIIISSEEERKSMQKELFSNNCNFNIEKLTLFINEINKT